MHLRIVLMIAAMRLLVFDASGRRELFHSRTAMRELNSVRVIVSFSRDYNLTKGILLE